MKRIVLSLILFVSLIGASFAENLFAHRFFEIKLDLPVAVSNNLVDIKSIMQEKVVIDLKEIADNMSKDGASIRSDAAPALSINLDIPRGLILGLNVGADADVSVGINKTIFEFLGNGNATLGGDFTVKMNNTYADVFAHASLTGGWNTKKGRVAITGTAFSAIAHVDASDTYVSVYTKEEKNTFGAEANVDARLYAVADVSGENMNDIDMLINQATSNMGFDIGADLTSEFSRYLTLGVKANIPLVPSKLGSVASVQYNMKKEICLDDILGKEGESTEGESSAEGTSESTSEASTENSSEASEESSLPSMDTLQFQTLTTPYEIHRPLKAGVSANFHPFGTLLSTNGYLGVGVRHPFAKDNSTDFYVDYSVGGRLSLWNIISVEVSHSRMDEIYKNELALALNIRLVELDAGVSFQSADFAKSFQGAGVGAYVTVAIGF